MLTPASPSWSLRVGVLSLVVCLGLAVGATLATAAVKPGELGSPVIGPPQLNSGRAHSYRDDSRTGTVDLKCGSGSYDTDLFAEGSFRGIYYTLVRINFCQISFGRYGVTVGAATNHCYGTRPVLTGLRVDEDYYIKDFELRCGEILSSSGTGWDVYTDPDEGKWMLHVEDPDDKQTYLECGPQQIVTGLRIGFYEKNGVTAFTSIQLYCSTVSKAHLTTTKPDPTATTRVATTTAATTTRQLPTAVGKPTTTRGAAPTTASRLPKPASQSPARTTKR